eukprot:scaffold16240_cov80-Skeletonema_marinoi.AAC.1
MQSVGRKMVFDLYLCSSVGNVVGPGTKKNPPKRKVASVHLRNYSTYSSPYGPYHIPGVMYLIVTRQRQASCFVAVVGWMDGVSACTSV